MDIEFEGELTDKIKRDIDCLVNAGFDPERELEQTRRQKAEEERKANLLLPSSCLPTLGEVIVSQGVGKTIQEMVSEFEKIILSTPPSQNITFDLTDFESIKACEMATAKYKLWMESNHIRLIITDRMKKALLDGIQASHRYSN
jgi:hypothetical protein